MGVIANKLQQEQSQSTGLIAKAQSLQAQPKGNAEPFGPSAVGQTGNSLSNIGIGIGSAVGKGVLGVPQAALSLTGKAATALGASNVGGFLSGGADAINNLKTGVYEKPFGNQLNTASGKIGTGIGTAATYLAPAGLASKGEIAIDTLSLGIKSPLLGAVTRIGGKAAVQGLAAGSVDLANTGGDLKSAGKTALGAGLIRGSIATAGETARAAKIPEWLYQNIFKNSSKDMLAELKADSIKNLQVTNPEKYNELVKAGIIKSGKGINPTLNKTLAEKALERGLRGNTQTMANTVVHGALDSESKAQTIAKNYKGTVNLSEPQFTNILKKIASDYEDVGFGEISNQAQTLNDVLKANNGKVSATTALEIRRLLDKARLASSFDRPASSLSMTQSNLKTLADAARKRVNSVPGMSKVMENYAFNIDALEALAKDASRRGNNQIIGLIDSAFLGGGLLSGNAAQGALFGTIRKYAGSPLGLTTLGQVAKNPNLGPKTSAAIGAISKAAGSALGSQLSQ
jgi:hypothetical protein